jgi:hypothetical protein
MKIGIDVHRLFFIKVCLLGADDYLLARSIEIETADKCNHPF